MSAPLEPPTLDEIRRVHERIAPHILRTPLEPCPWLGARVGVPVSVKWESLQRTGSFKLRGALARLLALVDEGADALLAVSAGNHGLGVAHAARLLGLRATVVVPESAVRTKVEAIAALGVELVQLGAGYDEAELAARSLAAERGVPFVSPYNDRHVIAGQATLALEVLEDAEPELLLVPAGGGGLLAGAALVAHGLGRATRVVGAQPSASPAMHAALASGGIVPIVESDTLADGLAGNLEPGSVTVPWVARHAHGVVLVSERGIARAIRGHARHDHQIVEGSAAVVGAALLEGAASPRGPVVALVTGRNLDVERLSALLASGHDQQ